MVAKEAVATAKEAVATAQADMAAAVVVVARGMEREVAEVECSADEEVEEEWAEVVRVRVASGEVVRAKVVEGLVRAVAAAAAEEQVEAV